MGGVFIRKKFKLIIVCFSVAVFVWMWSFLTDQKTATEAWHHLAHDPVMKHAEMDVLQRSSAEINSIENLRNNLRVHLLKVLDAVIMAQNRFENIWTYKIPIPENMENLLERVLFRRRDAVGSENSGIMENRP